MSNPNSHIVSPDRWFADGINGDVLLCDPFTGQPYVWSERQSNPPGMFANDIDLGGGYGIWQGSQAVNDGEQMSVGVLLTDPSKPDGLGDLPNIRENMDSFSVVGYLNSRSVAVESPCREYQDALFGVAAELNKPLFGVDLEVDFFGQPAGAAEMALTEINTALRAECIAQDPADSDLAVMGMDVIACQETQWYAMGRAGNEVAKIWGDVGVFPPDMLLIVPAEQHHIARKAHMCGPLAVEAIFARPEYAGITEALAYPQIMETGIIPGSALK